MFVMTDVSLDKNMIPYEYTKLLDVLFDTRAAGLSIPPAPSLRTSTASRAPRSMATVAIVSYATCT